MEIRVNQLNIVQGLSYPVKYFNGIGFCLD